MEPKLPAPSPSPETGAYNPQVLPPSPEMVPSAPAEKAPERPAQQEVQPMGPVQSGPALPTPTLPQQPAAPVPPVFNPVAQMNDNPASAADEEVIEKEWVDKAKKIVVETKDDPYQQEKEVSKLQADYLKKRYGKEVKVLGD